MSRTLVFDDESPSFSKKHLTIFAENRPAFSDTSPDDVVLDIYQGDISYLYDTPDKMHLTRVTLDGYDFHHLLESLAQFDTVGKEAT